MSIRPAALLGVDVGTSGVKVVAVGVDGRILAESSRGYAASVPRPGWAESAPEGWWAATAAAIRETLAVAGGPEVLAVGVDGQMHGLVLADAAGRPVRPAILWTDVRAAGEIAVWEALAAPVRRRLANPLVPGMTGPLMAWVRRNEPRVYARAEVALLPKDWLRHRLTGVFATDPSDASATLLWDVPGDGWSAPALAAAGLDAGLLPPVVESGDAAGTVTDEAGSATGVTAGVPVACGAGDSAAGMLATGLRDPLDLQITVGTGAQAVRPVARPFAQERPRTHLYRACEPGRWYAMAAVQNAGLALDWVRRVLGLSWEELYAAATALPPGADGVTFVPYLTGERSPVLNAQARAGWHGLGLSTDRAALAQSALEGVAFAVRHAVEALPEAAGAAPEARPIRLAGGGVAAPAFRALLADVLRARLRPIRVRSAAAVGAALLAASAAGLPAPPVTMASERPVAPSARADAYDGPYERYRGYAEIDAGDLA